MKKKSKKEDPLKKRVGYMRVALNMAGVHCDDRAVETIVHVTDAMEKVGGKFSLKQASEIKEQVATKYGEKDLDFRRSLDGILTDMKQIVADLKAMKPTNTLQP